MKKTLKKTLTIVLEITLFFSLLLAYDAFWGEGLRFKGFVPHPFWVPVLLMSLQYGSFVGLCTAFVASLALYLGNLPEVEVFEDLYSYMFSLFYLPLLWLISSVVIGEMRNAHFGKLSSLEEEKQDLEKEKTLILDAFTKLEEEKDALEDQLVVQMRTPLELYHGLEAFREKKVDLEMLLQKIFPVHSFSIYQMKKNSLSLWKAFSWKKSYRKVFALDDPLFDAMKKQKRLFCQESEEDANILQGQGLLAIPLVEPLVEQGSVLGMLKIEELDTAYVDFSSLELLATFAKFLSKELQGLWQPPSIALENEVRDLEIKKERKKQFLPKTGLFYQAVTGVFYRKVQKPSKEASLSTKHLEKLGKHFLQSKSKLLNPGFVRKFFSE